MICVSAHAGKVESHCYKRHSLSVKNGHYFGSLLACGSWCPMIS